MIVSRYHDISCGHLVSGHSGKCRNLHGHNYRIHFECAGQMSEDMVIDFAVIKSILCQWLEDTWDHRFLVWENDPKCADLRLIDHTVVAVPFNPTAENMAQYLLWAGQELLPDDIRLVRVIVEETRKCSAIADTITYLEDA